MSKTYFVIGGVFKDMESAGTSVRNANFRAIEDGTHEVFGPFNDPAEAERVRDGRVRRMIDICWHKLYVLEWDFYGSETHEYLKNEVERVMFHSPPIGA